MHEILVSSLPCFCLFHHLSFLRPYYSFLFFFSSFFSPLFFFPSRHLSFPLHFPSFFLVPYFSLPCCSSSFFLSPSLFFFQTSHLNCSSTWHRSRFQKRQLRKFPRRQSQKRKLRRHRFRTLFGDRSKKFAFRIQQQMQLNGMKRRGVREAGYFSKIGTRQNKLFWWIETERTMIVIRIFGDRSKKFAYRSQPQMQWNGN